MSRDTIPRHPLSSTQRFLVQHPYCCFCGGNTLATTRDHVPAKCLFDQKHRPNSLVFPSCDSCQRLSKKHELVAAMVARIYPDAKTKTAKLEVKKYIERANRAEPGLLREMLATPDQLAKLPKIRSLEPQAAGVLSFRGKLLNSSMENFGVKLTCALYYEHSGKIVGLSDAISVRIYTNYDAIMQNIPEELFRILGRPMTLQQGKWSVPHQFFYQYALTERGAPGAFFSVFRRSFAVLGLVWGSEQNVPKAEGMPTYVPTGLWGFSAYVRWL